MSPHGGGETDQTVGCWPSSCSWISACFKVLGCNCVGPDDGPLCRLPAVAAAPEPDALFVFQAAGESTQHPLKPSRTPNCDASLAKTNLLGVADGVNSVAEEGVDPSILPRELLSRCLVLANRARSAEQEFYTETQSLFGALGLTHGVPTDLAKRILCRAATELRELGSTTVSICLLHRRQLHVATVGDAGLLLFRVNTSVPTYTLVGRTPAGLHTFNSPYQICRMAEPDPPTPQRLLYEAAALTSSQVFELQDGDIVVVASDGLLDNLHPDEITEALNLVCLPSVPTRARGVSRVPLIRPERIAKYLVDAALLRANPRHGRGYPTPFAEAWFRYSGRHITGGKYDDTTAVVAYVEATAPLSQFNVVPARASAEPSIQGNRQPHQDPALPHLPKKRTRLDGEVGTDESQQQKAGRSMGRRSPRDSRQVHQPSAATSQTPGMGQTPALRRAATKKCVVERRASEVVVPAGTNSCGSSSHAGETNVAVANVDGYGVGTHAVMFRTCETQHGPSLQRMVNPDVLGVRDPVPAAAASTTTKLGVGDGHHAGNQGSRCDDIRVPTTHRTSSSNNTHNTSSSMTDGKTQSTGGRPNPVVGHGTPSTTAAEPSDAPSCFLFHPLLGPVHTPLGGLTGRTCMLMPSDKRVFKRRDRRVERPPSLEVWTENKRRQAMQDLSNVPASVWSHITNYVRDVWSLPFHAS